MSEKDQDQSRGGFARRMLSRGMFRAPAKGARPEGAPAAPAGGRKRINLALQGGGAHGAFTWGVLDRLLEEDRFDVTAISGTSAGAMNAVAFADGMREGGPDGARGQLARFWRAASLDGRLTDQQRAAMNSFLNLWGLNRNNWFENIASYVSPYDFNPLDINPLRDILTREIDFDAVRQTNDLKLFIAATNVQTGKVRVFRRPELTIDMVLASACLPTVFKAVEIEGVPYWDGGYMGNPVLFPFFTETDCDDVVLVQINPIERDETPRTAAEIMARLNEITFNAPMLAEFRAIDFVSRLYDAGMLKGTHYRKIRLHLIEADSELKKFGSGSKMNAEFSFFQKLFEIGRQAADDFIKHCADDIGVRDTLDLKEKLV
jgi:NTE family protein